MRPYLEGYRFTVITDHQSLKCLRELKNPSGRLARWAIYLQQFDFEVRYRKSSANALAETLSRQACRPPTGIPACALSPTDGPADWHSKKKALVLEKPADHPEYRVTNEKLFRRFEGTTELMN